MTDAPRYPVTPKHPPFNVRVVVHWNGRTFRAARVTHPKERRYCWVRNFEDGGHVYLPPKIYPKAKKKAAQAWDPEPEWWRPENPEAWQGALPEPLPPIAVPEYRRVPDVSRMINIRARRQRQETAEDKSAAEKTPWWWDASKIKYQPEGEVDLDMAIGRLMRAAAVSGASGLQGAPEKRKDKTFDSIAEAAAEAAREAEQAKESSSRRERFQPGPADLRDWITAMSWFAALGASDLNPSLEPWELTLEQEVIVWRANRRSWRSIATELGRSAHYARDIYRNAMEKIWRAANGQDVLTYRRNPDPLSKLRERNRAFHNRESQYD